MQVAREERGGGGGGTRTQNSLVTQLFGSVILVRLLSALLWYVFGLECGVYERRRVQEMAYMHLLFALRGGSGE